MTTTSHTPATRRRRGLVVALLAAGLLLTAQPAALAAAPGSGRQDILRIAEGPVSVGPADTVGVLLVADGDVVVDGKVDTVVATRGDVLVRGHVTGLAMSVDGQVTVAAGGRVDGDVYSSRPPEVAAAATVTGTVDTVNLRDLATAFNRMLGIITWLGVTVALFVLGLLMLLVAPRGTKAAMWAGTERMGPSVAAGTALAVGVPVAAVASALTIIGVPLAAGILAALLVAGAVGYVVAAMLLGGLLMGRVRQPVVELLVGLLVLQLLAVVPVLGVVAPLVAAYGLGAVAVAAWRTHTPPAAAPRPPVRVAAGATR
jgi:hypothetical protein